ncbi:MAG TPA: hypothetical protein PK971_08130 [Saprospiraceae bacterium]|nr:hypothetical protein [Saprospiraceae bacterium]HND88281.1 hypothetical protein [Saprospiraceae bacterium]
MKHTLLLLLLTALTFTACKKDPEEVVALLSETEAAEIVETALSDRTAGMESPTADLAKLIESSLSQCGVPGDTSLSKNKAGVVSYNYTYALGWVVNCNALNIPQNASTTLKGSGSFGTARWDGNTQGSGSLVFTGLAPSEPNYIANGSYTAAGTLNGDFRQKDPSISCTTELTLSNMSINKTTRSTNGGTGTVKIVATAANGSTQTLDGSLVFNSDGSITVTVNGHSHTF